MSSWLRKAMFLPALFSRDANLRPCTADTPRNWKSFLCGIFIPYLESRCRIATPAMKFWTVWTWPTANKCISLYNSDGLATSFAWSKWIQRQSKKSCKFVMNVDLHCYNIRPKGKYEYVNDRTCHCLSNQCNLRRTSLLKNKLLIEKTPTV